MHWSVLFENTTRAGACSKQPGNPICTLHGTFKNIWSVPTEALLWVLPGRAKNGVFHLFENVVLVAFFQEAKSVKIFVIPFKHNQGTHPELTSAASQEIVRPFLRVRGDSFAGRGQSFSHDMYFLAQQHQPCNGSQQFFCVLPM